LKAGKMVEEGQTPSMSLLVVLSLMARVGKEW
jgi:hypothetical protein